MASHHAETIDLGHAKYEAKNLAEIPVYTGDSHADGGEPVRAAALEEHLNEPSDWPTIESAEIEALRGKLPVEPVLAILKMANYDVRRASELIAGKEVPELVPQFVKDFFTANVSAERSAREKEQAKKRRRPQVEHFYCHKTVHELASSEDLVKFYYKQKMSSKRKRVEPETYPNELKERMKGAGIRFVNCNETAEHREDKKDNDDDVLF